MQLLRESDSLEKNNLTVQEWNKFYIELIVYYMYTEKQQSSSITVD